MFLKSFLFAFIISFSLFSLLWNIQIFLKANKDDELTLGDFINAVFFGTFSIAPLVALYLRTLENT